MRRSRLVWAPLAVGLLVFAGIDLFTFRIWDTVPLSVKESGPAFGYVTAAQRASFDRLSELVPAGSLIGASFDDGATELYAGRRTFRPGAWSQSELIRFTQAEFERGRSLYILEDGVDSSRAVETLRRQFHFELIRLIDVPLAGDGPIASPGAVWKITE